MAVVSSAVSSGVITDIPPAEETASTARSITSGWLQKHTERTSDYLPTNRAVHHGVLLITGQVFESEQPKTRSTMGGLWFSKMS